MASENIHNNILNDLEKFKVGSSSEMTTEEENRLLDNAEMWTASDNVLPKKEDENCSHLPTHVLKADSGKVVPVRQKKLKRVVEATKFLNLRKRLKIAEELLEYVKEEMVPTKNKPLVGKMIETFKNGGGTFLYYYHHTNTLEIYSTTVKPHSCLRFYRCVDAGRNFRFHPPPPAGAK